MKHIRWILPFIPMLLVSVCGCKSEKDAPNPDIDNCFSGEVIRSIKNQKGLVYYDPVEKLHSISVHTPGTIDVQDIGIICETSIIPKESGLKVSFSGKYYEFNEENEPQIIGTKYYNLHVTSFQVDK